MPSCLIPIYQKLPVTLTRGEGVWLYDDQGRQYLDALSGIGVCALGHNHPAITKTITEQAARLLQVSNAFHTPWQTALANKLCGLSGLAAAYFSNSGTEANEAVIKMALKYGTSHGIATPKIIVMEGGYHGRSLGAWSASCDHSTSQFGPLMPCFIRVPFNDINAINAIKDPNVIAIMLEPVFGKGGLRPASLDYIHALREYCDQHHCLLILDEIQSGMGRTGKLFAYQHTKILPDMLTTAKTLGNGIPIGAYLCNHKVAKVIKPGDHGSTQGGNPFACAVALTVLETFEKEHLYTHVTDIGHYLQQALREALRTYPVFDNIQGKGLMIGIKLKHPIPNIVAMGLEQGIIFNLAGETVIRLLPPYIITQAHADLIVERLSKTLGMSQNGLHYL